MTTVALKQMSGTGAVLSDVVTFNGSQWAPASPGTSGTLSDTYTCPLTVAVLDAVYLSLANTVDKADANDPTKRPCVGIVRSKPTPTSAVVQVYGPLTGFVGLTPGASYYPSETPGLITAVAPTVAPTSVQPVGYAKNSTDLQVMVDRYFTLIT
jgi:hypothetical protein